MADWGLESASALNSDWRLEQSDCCESSLALNGSNERNDVEHQVGLPGSLCHLEETLQCPCTLECGSSVDLRKLGLCRNALSEDERATEDQKPEPDSTEHLLAKKYGGFMKRYGGFMMKKSPEDLTEDEADGVPEEELDILREILRVGLDANEHGKELTKRYGGFMRRVGRPQWLDESKPYGLHKRWEDEGAENVLPETHKRYGGFMD
ncbi:proenkephalin a [Tachysurus ichikawai]